jgi:hypothetical protein
MKWPLNLPRATVLLAALVMATLFALSCVHVRFGYDEAGPVISHLELDDPAFIAEYVQPATAHGVPARLAQPLLVDLVLPVFVVPIRWTYALGISPWLGVVRLLPLDWTWLRPLLTLPYLLLAGAGLLLGLKSIADRTTGATPSLVFLALLACSTQMFWWTTSLSSYSHHLLCFGMLMHAALAPTPARDRWLGQRAVLRALAPVFNYQYVPVVMVMGAVEFLRGPRAFFAERRYRGWVLPALSCIASAAFLVVRSRLSGKHDHPTTSTLTPEQIHLYSLPQQATSVAATLQAVASRYIDIVHSFFAPVRELTVLAPWAAVAVLLAAALAVWIIARVCDRDLLAAVCAMLLGSIVLHVAGLLPVSPTRHQLVMFLPTCVLGGLLADALLGLPQAVRIRMHVLPALAAAVCVLGLAWQLKPVFEPPSGMPVQAMRDTLASEHVERLVLSDCELEPVLYPDLRRDYAPLYRCGPNVVHRLPDGVRRVALWSSRPLNLPYARRQLAAYSPLTWTLRPVVLDAAAVGHPPHNIVYIAEAASSASTGSVAP